MIPTFSGLSRVKREFFNANVVFRGIFRTQSQSLSRSEEKPYNPVAKPHMPQNADYLEICTKAVKAAGATIQDWVGRTSIQRKGPADFVTEADFAAQELVRKTILGAFP